MKVLHTIYNNTDIEFALNGENIMVNATQMAQAFNKRIDHFLRSDHAQNYIKVLENFLQKENNLPPNGGRIIPKVIEYKGRNGVLFDRRLALKFAAWLDVEFELWVYTTIDRMLLGHFKDLKDATAEKLKAQEELKLKREELLKKHPEDFAEFLSIEEKLNSINKKRMKALKQGIKQLQLELFPEK